MIDKLLFKNTSIHIVCETDWLFRVNLRGIREIIVVVVFFNLK